MRKSNKKLKILSVLLICIFLLPELMIINNNFQNNEGTIIKNNPHSIQKYPKVSGTDPHIYVFQNNFSGVPGITGEGSFGNPWVIQDKIIDGQDTGNCILIEDSTDYFRIENCTVYNASTSSNFAEIKLDQSSNGTIFNNTVISTSVSASHSGILLYDSCKNNTISNNKINISGTGTYQRKGIYLYREDSSNKIYENVITGDNTAYSYGVHAYGFGNPSAVFDNIIYKNDINRCGYGVNFNYVNAFNNISENIITDSDRHSLYFWYANHTISSNNYLDHAQRPIYLRESNNNTFFGNFLLDSTAGVQIYYIGTSENNTFYENYFIDINYDVDGNQEKIESQFWNTTDTGNYWSDYVGTDIDDDGRGDSPFEVRFSASTGVYDYFPLWADGVDLQGGNIRIDALATGVDAKNWTWASQRPWCTGMGTEEDPYVIGHDMAGKVKLGALTINGNAVNSCISISNSSEHFRIEDTTLYNSANLHAGISLFNVNNSWIQNNNCSNNLGHGISLQKSNNNTLGDNIVRDNGLTGIRVDECSENLITGNLLSGHISNIHEISGTENIIQMNKIDDIYYRMLIDNDAAVFTGAINWTTAAQFHWCSGSGTVESPYTIKDYTISGNGTGHSVHIRDSSVEALLYNLTIIDAGSSANDAGLNIYFVSQLTVFMCNISYNPQKGIQSSGGEYNNFTRNEVVGNDDGFYFSVSDYNNFSQNIIAHNTNMGVFLSTTLFDCDFNTFERNYFIGNTQHAIDMMTTNYWNTQKIGNFWDNYTEMGVGAVDDNDDGIGDIPYIQAQENAIDYLPIYDDGFNGTQIYIDDTGVNADDWAWAETRSWCSGKGTQADPYVIEDLIINGKNSAYCIKIRESNKYFIIKNCTLYNTSGPYGAIHLYRATNGTIVDNIVANVSSNGIILEQWCHKTNVSDNEIYNSSKHGIYVYASSRCDIMNNEIYNCTGDGQYGIFLFWGCWENNVSWNRVYNCSGTNRGGIRLDSTVAQSYVKYNTILQNDGHGIWLYRNGTYNEIYYNNISFNSGAGIRIETAAASGEGSDFNKIYRNNIYNNTHGIYLQGVMMSWYNNDNKINYNLITNNSQYGVFSSFSRDTEISNNLISQNGVEGTYAAIFGSFITNGMNITQNMISDNFHVGVALASSAWGTIYNNTFISNGLHAICNNTNAQWNYTGIGNNWDDYDGWDIDGDGIGESLYNISGTGDSYDYYPITTPNTVDMSIKSLDTGSTYGKSAPEITLIIEDPYLDKIWYNIDGKNNYTFNFPTDVINEILWESLPENVITFYFYANDTLGNIISGQIVLTKNIASTSDKKDDTPTTEPQDLTLIYIIIGIVAIVAVMGLVLARKSKSQLKERDKELEVLRAQKEEITEDDIIISKEKHICLVHKGPIEGYSYICPGCGAYYCSNCVEAIKQVENACWSCGISLDPSRAKAELEERQFLDKKKPKKIDVKPTDDEELKETIIDEDMQHKAPKKQKFDFQFEDQENLSPPIKKEKLSIKAQLTKPQEIEKPAPPPKAPAVQPQVSQKEATIHKFEDYLKKMEEMGKNLEEKFRNGEITQEEYIQKRTMIAEKMGEALGKLEQLRQ